MSLTRRRCIFAGLSTLGLAGCEALGLSGSNEPRLEGERIPVMLLDEKLNPDPRLAQLQIVLPRPRRNRDWTQHGGNARHAMQHLALGAHPEPAWTAEIGSGSDDESKLLAQPLVAAETVFTVDTEPEVRAFDLASGRQRWSSRPELVETVDRLRAGGLAYENGRLFLSTTSGEIFSLDAANGKILWHRPLLAPILAPPTVESGRLFVVTADNRMIALATEDGTPVWQHAGLFEQAGILGGAPVGTDGRTVVVPYSSGEIFGLRYRDGRPLWSDSVLRPRRTLGLGAIGDITAAPVLDGDRVYVVGNGGEMAAIRIDRGNRIWDLQVASRVTPWIAGEFLYLLTDHNQLACLLRRGGGVRWVNGAIQSLSGDSPEERIWSAPVVAGNRIVLASTSGIAVSLSPYTGEVLGQVDLPGPVRLGPVVASETLLFLTETARLVAFR